MHILVCNAKRKMKVTLNRTHPQKAAFNYRGRNFSTKSTCYWGFMANLQPRESVYEDAMDGIALGQMVQSILTRSLPVFRTEASTVSLSHGIRVLRSINSQDIPSYKLHHFVRYVHKFTSYSKCWFHFTIFHHSCLKYCNFDLRTQIKRSTAFNYRDLWTLVSDNSFLLWKCYLRGKR